MAGLVPAIYADPPSSTVGLRLVEHRHRPVDGGEPLLLARQQSLGRDQHIAGAEPAYRLRAIPAFRETNRAQGRREALDLGDPVAAYGGWRDDQDRAGRPWRP